MGSLGRVLGFIYARAFGHPLCKLMDWLSGFVTNPNVTGAYAEAWVRSMAREYARPSV